MAQTQKAQIDSLSELMHRKEDLHEDLAAYLETHPTLGQVLRHPLVYDVPYFPQMNALHNVRYQQKLSDIAKATAEKAWGSILVLHERPWRFQAFCEIEHRLADKEYWENLGWVWTDSENIHAYRDEWEAHLRSPRLHRECFMDEDDRKELAKLPDTLTVYRGYEKGRNFDGLSFTLDRDRAEWFAKRYSKVRGVVRTMTIPKSRVFAYLTGRNEQEVIVLPHRKGV